MLPTHFGRYARILAVVGLLAAAPMIASAGLGHRHDCCPDCGSSVCVPSFEKVKEKKHCWCVECEQICIPRFRWPWQSCCELPKCGRVKNVKRLKKIEYECEKCGCKWDVQSVGCCENGACQQ
jgi:hypothetical protein